MAPWRAPVTICCGTKPKSYSAVTGKSRITHQRDTRSSTRFGFFFRGARGDTTKVSSRGRTLEAAQPSR